MNSSRRIGRFISDIVSTAFGHPVHFSSLAARSLIELRATAAAHIKHGLQSVSHDSLDPRLVRLAVEIGGASPHDQSKDTSGAPASALNLTKALIVCRFAKMLSPQRVLEIGTYRGCMTYHIARNTGNECQIWTLDLPQASLDSLSTRMISSDIKMADLDDSVVGCEWTQAAEADRITQLWGDSLNFDFTPYAPFELIYIDGSHAREWVWQDTHNAFRFLAPTGAILWDDVYWSDVQAVLCEFAQSRPIYLFEDGHTAGYLQVEGCGVSIPSQPVEK